MLLHRRARQLRHLAPWLRHQQLAPRALAAAGAFIQAEARLRMRHLRRPHLRLTPRPLPPAEEVEAADRTEPFFIEKISKKKKRLLGLEPFFFSGRSRGPQDLKHYWEKIIPA